MQYSGMRFPFGSAGSGLSQTARRLASIGTPGPRWGTISERYTRGC